MSLFTNNVTTKSAFGGGSGNQPSSVFSSKSGTQPSSVFGSKGGTQPSSVFGSKGGTQPNSVFGGQVNANVNNTSAFAAPQPGRAVRPSSNSLFGKKTQSSGGSIPSNTTPQSLFSNAQQPQSQTQTSAAPTPTAVFGKSSHTSARSVFGGAASGLTTGGAASGLTTGGAASDLPTGGAPSQQQPARSLFMRDSVPATPDAPAARAKTLFGKPATAAFSSQSSADHSRLYSQLTDLTSEDIATFTAAQFSMGCIPLKLPPRELCFG